MSETGTLLDVNTAPAATSEVADTDSGEVFAAGTIPRELMDELRQANTAYRAAAANYADASDRAKLRKKAMEATQASLNAVAYRIACPAVLPLFDEAGETEPTEAEADAGAWRDVLLAGMVEPRPISDRYIKAMGENHPPITTLGELADWQAGKGDFWAKDISGLGEKGQEQIVAAADAYWALNKPEPVEPAAAPEADPDGTQSVDGA